MNDQRIGSALRAVRVRRRLRQSDVAAKAGMGRNAVIDLEHGRLDGHRVGVLRAVAAVLGVRVEIDIDWHGANVDRLLDRARGVA